MELKRFHLALKGDIMFSSQQPDTFTLFLQKARQLDLSPIAYQLMQSPTGPRWTREKTVKAIARYLAFLYLADSYRHLQLVPSQEIDQVWHYHILDTSKYVEDCQMLFGYMIHHFPYLGLRGEQDRCNQSKAYSLTQTLFSKHFSGYFVDQELHPSDCEPIRSEIMPIAGCSHVSQLRSRLHTPLATEEVLAKIALSLN